jgi:hypothetical protein
MYESEPKGVPKLAEGFGGVADDAGVNPVMAKVLATPGGHVLFADSPLAPSRPGCAGDLGTVGGGRVVDVVEEPGGLLHVMAHQVDVRRDEWVPIWRDPDRRQRLERTHGATAACLASLARERLAVVSMEIVAGLAWLEVSADAPAIDLAPLVGRNEPIEVIARSGNEMTVYVDGQAVRTVPAPIARSTGALAGIGVRSVAALDDGREALEVSLPDAEGREWWR